MVSGIELIAEWDSKLSTAGAHSFFFLLPYLFIPIICIMSLLLDLWLERELQFFGAFTLTTQVFRSHIMSGFLEYESMFDVPN